MASRSLLFQKAHIKFTGNMAAIRKLSNIITLGHLTKPDYSFLPSNPLIPGIFVSSRGIASKLFVGGLSFYTTEQGLSEAFSQHGEVIEAKIVMDRVSDRSKGFGFVTYASEDEAERAVTEMNGKPLNGRAVFVDYAKPRRSGFSSSMPIARGPPEPVADNYSSAFQEAENHQIL